MGFILSKLFSKKLEMCILGLEGCGKTTFVNQLMGESKKTVPTIGLNVKSYKKGSLSMKIWDIGGQFQYRPNWVDYAKLCDVIVFLVDSSNYDTISSSKQELQSLLDNKGIESKPILVLSNKIDIDPHMSENEIIKELNLDYVYSNPWAVIKISALKGTNFEEAIVWLEKQGK